MRDKRIPPNVVPARERIPLTAMRLFAQQGFHNTSIREIARAACVNVAAISYHFGGKAGLYRAILDTMREHHSTHHSGFDRPGYTLRQSLTALYGQMLRPLGSEDAAWLRKRLWLWEMLEPTDVCRTVVNRAIGPEHDALAWLLARHFGLPVPDDGLHVLAICIASLPLALMAASGSGSVIARSLLAGPDPFGPWIERFTCSAEAMIAAERQSRETKMPSARRQDMAARVF